MIEEIRYCLNKKKHKLTGVLWECTSRCNLYCQHCYMNASSNNKEPELNTEEAIKVFSDMRKICSSKNPILSITGGEPLMREDLFVIVEKIRSYGFDWTLTTNGTLIDLEKSRKINELSPLAVSVSIDGLKDYHNSFRSGDNAFDNAIDGINRLVAAGYKKEKIVIKTILRPEIVKEIYPIYKMILSLGITSWHILTILDLGRAKSRDYYLNAEQIDLSNKIITELKGLCKMNITIDEGASILKEAGSECKRKCLSGSTSLSLLSNGDVIGCINSLRGKKHIQGNVLTKNIKEIWNKGFRENRSIKWRGCSVHKYSRSNRNPNK